MYCIWGLNDHVSGLWHHLQRILHPFKNTTVLIPGPSWIDILCSEVIRPFIFAVLDGAKIADKQQLLVVRLCLKNKIYYSIPTKAFFLHDCLMQFPIVGWGLTVSKVELFIEISQASKAARMGNMLDRCSGQKELVGSILDADVVYEFS